MGLKMKTKQEIFDSLISGELGMLRAAAYRLLGDPVEVDDAIQEALLTAWNKFSYFRHAAKISTWVYRITVNVCCDRLRKRKRECAKMKLYSQSTAAASDSGAGNPQYDTVAFAVEELPEPYRSSILMVFFSNIDSADAASELGCSVNTLYQRIHKAKQLLKEKLQVTA